MAYFDKETLTNHVLQGAFTPLYVMVPEGNPAWYDADIAGEIASKYVGLQTSDRLAAAYAALEADGFTWEVPAVFDEEGTMVSPGAGIIDPEGNPVPVLEILVPDVQPLAHSQAATLWLEDWAESLGIPAEANKTNFNTVVNSVWPGIGTEPVFDMYVLGWTLGNPAWPTFHESFFHTRNMGETNDGDNSAGYSNPAFDALAETMFAETDYETAFSQVWQMEQMIAEDLPWVVLFDAPITEFYNEDLQYPFTQTLSGIRNLGGMQGTVSK
jgi:ABC-type transport system substrate-binding protein